jgi:hypothetical protein
MTPKIISVVLVLVCTLLLAVLLWPKTVLNAASKTVASLSSVSIKESTRPLASQTAYDAIVQKPLFNPSRMAIVTEPVMTGKLISGVEPKAVSTAASLPNLLGVMQVNGFEMAFVIGNEDVEPIGLRVGDSYQDWDLTSISGTEIVLSKNKTDETISLDWSAPGEVPVVNDSKQMMIDDASEKGGMEPMENPTSSIVSEPFSRKERDRLARQIDEDGGGADEDLAVQASQNRASEGGATSSDNDELDEKI